MRELTNLNWRDTPFGSSGQPVERRIRRMAGIATQWADNGGEPVLMAAAMVFVPVKLIGSVPVTVKTLHYGYQLFVAERAQDTREMAARVDQVLVQARKDAAAVAWHNALDDLHSLAAAHPHGPGIQGMTEAWQPPRGKQRGITARIDTARDVGPDGLLAETAQAGGLPLDERLRELQEQGRIQQAFAELTAGTADPDIVMQSMAAGALAQALTAAFLGGRHLDLLTWTTAPSVYDAINTVAWGSLPGLFFTTSFS
ncbi:hypothetical protein AB0G73_24265 [Streptomyces sp. NPDC020719]|uniref:hypothetical protein n=1 Tax=Streptomyces sp. NPDC020719 TaxID=3154896 RepID=UPI003411049B